MATLFGGLIYTGTYGDNLIITQSTITYHFVVIIYLHNTAIPLETCCLFVPDHIVWGPS